MINYEYAIEGTGAKSAPWSSSGTVTVATAGQFHAAIELAIGKSFHLLTEGRATYGEPGPCGGPFSIKSLTIKEVGE